MGDDNNYGSYAVLANLSVTMTNLTKTTDYKRVLDLSTGVHTATFKAGHTLYTR